MLYQKKLRFMMLLSMGVLILSPLLRASDDLTKLESQLPIPISTDAISTSLPVPTQLIEDIERKFSNLKQVFEQKLDSFAKKWNKYVFLDTTAIESTMNDTMEKNRKEFEASLSQVRADIKDIHLGQQKRKVFTQSLPTIVMNYVATTSIIVPILQWKGLLLPMIKAVAPQAVATVMPTIPYAVPALGIAGLAWWGKRMWDTQKKIDQYNQEEMFKNQHFIDNPKLVACIVNVYDFGKRAFKVMCAAGALAGFACLAQQQNNLPVVY